MTKFFKKFKNYHFWPILGQNMSFLQNSVLTSLFKFKLILFQIKKNKDRILSNTDFRWTNGWANKHEFIGLFQLKLEVQKESWVFKLLGLSFGAGLQTNGLKM